MSHKTIKIALAVSVAAHLLACSIPASAIDFSVGAEAGRCRSSVYMEMCNEHRLTWHVYGEAEHHINDNLSITGSVQHFSSFDGRADLTGDESNQSGSFDYVGAGLKWRF